MEILKGGKSKAKTKIKNRRADDVVDTDLPSKIEVTKRHSVVPGHIWRTKSFKWNPITFATEAEQLNSRFIEPGIQDRSLRNFLKDPSMPMIYGISGNPDDSKAKYFAAYLLDAHCKYLKSDANPVWATLYGNFDNPLLNKDIAKPSLLVISNLTPNSTTTKLEKARDLIEAFPDIPRLVICAGLDPVSFLSTRLFAPIHGLAYFSEALVKAKVEVI